MPTFSFQTSKLGESVQKLVLYFGGEFKTQFLGIIRRIRMICLIFCLPPIGYNIIMDFKQNKKNYSLSLLGSPLAYTFMYISNDKITDRVLLMWIGA